MSRTLTIAREYTISVATRDDIPQLLELQMANLVVNGGALSVEFSSEWFEHSIAEMPIMIARRDGHLVAYLVSSSRAATRHVALSEAKFCAYPNVTSEAYNCGPLCVAASERGHGLSDTLFRALRLELPSREAVAFIRSVNLASRSAHARMGFREVAEFSHAGLEYVVVSHPG
jgi:L-amino acid N-acyltransferase YncA